MQPNVRRNTYVTLMLMLISIRFFLTSKDSRVKGLSGEIQTKIHYSEKLKKL